MFYFFILPFFHIQRLEIFVFFSRNLKIDAQKNLQLFYIVSPFFAPFCVKCSFVADDKKKIGAVSVRGKENEQQTLILTTIACSWELNTVILEL